MEENELQQKHKKEINSDEIGIMSSDILIEKASKKSEEEQQQEHYEQLVRLAHEKEVLWGTVCGLQMSEDIANHFNVLVSYESDVFMIPDYLFFEANADYGSNYPAMNEKERCSHRFNMAQYYLNARIPFVLINDENAQIVRREVKNDLFDRSYVLEVYASRIKAMEMLRDIYFFHQEKHASVAELPTVEVNDVIHNGHVLTVKEESVTLEVCGCETWLDAYHLNTNYVDNCAKFVAPGDEIPVKVKRITLSPQKKSVNLIVSGRLFANNVTITTMREGDVLIGNVSSYNRLKGIYTVILKNGIKAACPEDTVAKRIPLAIGDLVMVYVRRINEAENFVSGRITKI